MAGETRVLPRDSLSTRAGPLPTGDGPHLAVAAGEVRAGVDPEDLLRAVASLCTSAYNVGPEHARRMVALLVDGLRYGARPAIT